MRTRDGLGMDWTRSGWTTGGLQQDSMSIGGLHVDSHRIPGGVKYTGQLLVLLLIFNFYHHPQKHTEGLYRAQVEKLVIKVQY